MLVMEITMGIVFLAVAVISVISDFKTKKIKNIFIFPCLMIAFILASIYYSVFARDIFLDFIINWSVGVILALILFFTKVWAGGDIKLWIVLITLYPARAYWILNGHIYTLFATLLFSFIFAYLFLVLRNIYRLSSQKISISKDYIKKTLMSFIKSYVISVIYVSFFYLLYLIWINNFIMIGEITLTLAFMLIAWMANTIKILSNKYLLLVLLIVDIVLSIIFKQIPVSTNWYHYILIFVLVTIKIFSATQNYDKIKSNEVTGGMILSSTSSMIMIASGVLPDMKMSKEDLGARLSKEEALIINAIEPPVDVLIIHKIPFAIFILLGFALYILLWGLTLWL